MITIDKKLVELCDKYLEARAEKEITSVDTKSKLIEVALVHYFNTLADLMDQELTKGEKKSES